ncbi:hypothetical protein N9061_01410 [bacterium]|nr:hypothetical protein [Mariniblastus sp.]MDB4386495.1 hypothetical protein [bacterium]MDB4357232.1 hypothetical protein [Mariniblastus sp.]MDB4372721.1 hypothetical protein [Mariniblastus sp.]MDB4380041.1 hypothetical protein [Mariniblastus sp.]
MPNIPVFIASCPGCAMKKQLNIDCLGRNTGCLRCGKNFIANGADSHSAAIEDPVHYWINFTAHDFQDEPLPEWQQSRDLTRTPR